MNESFLTWILLCVSIFVLVAVPFLSDFIKNRTGKIKYVGKILNWVFAAVLVFHLLPEVVGVAGYPAAIVAFVGFLVALGLDSLGSKLNAWKYIPAVVFVGLSLHGFLDGFAIKLSSGTLVHGLGEVVVFHRIFAGLFIWQVCAENYSKKVGISILSLLGITTILGFFFGTDLLRNNAFYVNISYIQAFIIGGVLHIAFHRDVTDTVK
jgi:zinc transporter ZupT